MDEIIVLGKETPNALVEYVQRQLRFFGVADEEKMVLRSAIGEALNRMGPITERVHAFRTGEFDPLHSLQYATFLYLTGHFVWQADHSARLVDRLFCLNKMLHGIELHPAVDLPGAFFFSHAIGSVLGAAEYGEDLVVFQNVTIGRIGNSRPTIGRSVVLFPGSAVTGGSVLGDDVVVSAGTRVHNLTVPSQSLVRSDWGSIVVEPLTRNYHALYIERAV